MPVQPCMEWIPIKKKTMAEMLSEDQKMGEAKDIKSNFAKN